MATEFRKTGIIQASILEQLPEVSIDKNDITNNANIMKNTYFTSNYSSYVTVDNNFRFMGLPTMKLNVSGYTSNSYIGYSQTLTGLKAGDIITVSVWIYRLSNHGIDNGTEMRVYQTHNDGSANNWTGFAPSDANWPANKWVQVYRTYTLDSNFASGVFNVNVVKNGSYWFTAPKVEFGNKRTLWVPNTTDDIYTKLNFAGANQTITNIVRSGEIIEN